MCGIAGFFSSQAGYRVPPDLTREVLDSMKNRGPDGSGIWEQRDLGALLMNCRLAIQDLTPCGDQPMHSHNRDLTIVFNGEIYNKDDLRVLVESYPFRGTSDTEVILALYEKFGAEMTRLLRGMYAFAIWDERRQGLFLARDPYGIKPLYLADTPEGVWFGSQVKTLLRVPEIDLSPAAAGHAGFFLWGSVPEPHTLYNGIRALPGGHSLWLERGKPPSEIEFASISAVLADKAESTPPVSLRDALFDSVRSHFLSDVPVSVFLSAGLDSSTILGISAFVFPAASINSLTLGFDKCRGTANDETREAAQVAAHYGVPQHIQSVGKNDFANQCSRFLNAMDQPTIDGINTYFISMMAHEAGYKVALSGLGGDELFGGYPSFREIPRLVKAMRKFPVSQKLGAVVRHWTEPLLKQITSPKYAGALEYGRSVEGAYLLRRALFMPWELADVMDHDMAAIGLEALADSEFQKKELNRIRNLPMRAQISFLESTRYMRNQLLRDADWAGMAHSLEIRTPLVDYTLLGKVAPLLRSSRAPGKLDMATTLPTPLPHSILDRRKTGFFVPVREWMMDSLEHRPERGLRSWAKFVYRHQWQSHATELKQST